MTTSLTDMVIENDALHHYLLHPPSRDCDIPQFIPNLISLLLAMKRRKGKIWLVVKKGAKYLPATKFISQKFLKERGKTCLDLETENSSCHPESYFKAKN